MRKRKSVNYINNKDLYEAMKALYEQKQAGENPRIPDYIGKCFLQICNKLGTRSNFAGYTYVDEMIDDAIENCVMAVHGFNPAKSINPFAYFSQIAWNAFVRRIKKEKKETYVKHKNFEMNNLLDELVEDSYTNRNNKDFVDTVITNYEESLVKK
jgi:hypothetical protein